MGLFLKEIYKIYMLCTIGAFTFSKNVASQRVLGHNGFELIEDFVEDGKQSKYYQLNISN